MKSNWTVAYVETIENIVTILFRGLLEYLQILEDLLMNHNFIIESDTVLLACSGNVSSFHRYRCSGNCGLLHHGLQLVTPFYALKGMF